MSLLTLVPNGGEFCVLRADIADRLISSGDGDGALLYLYLIRKSTVFDEQTAMRELGMDRARFERAVHTLKSIQVVSAPSAAVPRARAEDAPKYPSTEIAARRAADHRFDAVCHSAESVLGRTLTASALKTLYTAYEHLGLPADVLIDLLAYLGREKHPVTRRDIEQEAYLWADMGILTADDAAEYLARRENEKPLIAEMMRVLDMAGREPNPKEYRFLSELVHSGFTAEAVALARDKMYARLGKFSWNYLRGILQRWHEKNVHTAEEITALEPAVQTTPHGSLPAAPGTHPTAPAAPNPEQNPELEDWERDWLRQQEARIRRRKENNHG